MTSVTYAKDTKTGFEVQLLSSKAVEVYWNNISEMMDKVPHTWTHFTKEYFLAAAMNGNVQFWTAGPEDRVRVVIVTQIATFPAFRSLQIIWAAGEGALRELISVGEGAFEVFAREQECEYIEVIDGRGGWSHVLAPFGFEQVAIVLSRRVRGLERMN